jgi:hypothetical protein
VPSQEAPEGAVHEEVGMSCGVSGEATEPLTDPVESGVHDGNGMVDRGDQGTAEGEELAEAQRWKERVDESCEAHEEAVEASGLGDDKGTSAQHSDGTRSRGLAESLSVEWRESGDGRDH